MRTIYTENAPEPTGHRSQALAHNDLVFVSGQVPINPETGEKVTESIEKQTETALRNVEEILKASGCTLKNVLKTTLYITDMSSWSAIDSVYAEIFGEHKPARSVIRVSELHHGVQIQIEAIAYIEEKRPFWH
ncbi:RidA family protein [candidate division KSB1 bacterium]